eukprot:scaffold2386_cov126-Skeletonema_marinoi.AAC.3
MEPRDLNGATSEYFYPGVCRIVFNFLQDLDNANHTIAQRYNSVRRAVRGAGSTYSSLMWQ